MRAKASEFLRRQRGATAIEYALIAALLGAGIVVAVATLGDSLEATFHHLEAALPGGDKPGHGPPPGSGNGNGNNGNGKGNGGPKG